MRHSEVENVTDLIVNVMREAKSTSSTLPEGGASRADASEATYTLSLK